ncbi:MAG: hypothetical protein RSE41_05805 [Clostridia bacterium]
MLEEKVREAISKVLNDEGVILCDVVTTQEDGKKVLQIIIDTEGVMDLNLCVKATKIINPLIDNLIDETYDEVDVCSLGEDEEESEECIFDDCECGHECDCSKENKECHCKGDKK